MSGRSSLGGGHGQYPPLRIPGPGRSRQRRFEMAASQILQLVLRQVGAHYEVQRCEVCGHWTLWVFHVIQGQVSVDPADAWIASRWNSPDMVDSELDWLLIEKCLSNTRQLKNRANCHA